MPTRSRRLLPRSAATAATADWLILHATPLEGAQVRAALTHCRESTVAGLSCTLGRAADVPVILIATGIGEANAAFAAGVALAQFRVRQVLSFGVAGGYSTDGWQVGDLAHGTVFGLGDEGVIGPTGWQDLGAIGIPLCDTAVPGAFNRVPARVVALPAALRRGFATASDSSPAPRAAGILTVVACSGTAARARAMRARAASLGASTPATRRLPWVEDMETAAVALACARANKPLLALRAISNRAGDRNKARWDLKGAARAAQAAAWRAITGLPLETAR